jgi:hypothetical protein
MRRGSRARTPPTARTTAGADPNPNPNPNPDPNASYRMDDGRFRLNTPEFTIKRKWRW